MKRIVLLTIAIGICVHAFCSDYFYYYHGERLNLNILNSYIGLKMGNVRGCTDLLVLNGAEILTCDSVSGYAFVKCPNKSVYANVIDICMESNTVETFSPVFYYGDSELLLAGASRVMVTLNEKSDSVLLNRLVSGNGYSIVYVDPFDSLFYVVHTNSRDGASAFHAANSIYETGLFRAVSPDFLSTTLENVEASNDADRDLIPDIPVKMIQWNFYCPTDTSVDINAQQAWQITNGDSNIIVAMFDYGVELDHPALQDNLTLGYDAILDVYPAGSPAGSSGAYEHGTKCTGVIVAKKVSLLGVKGLASGSKVMPIRMLGGASSSSDFIRAINFAKNNGASIINMSWWLCPTENMEIALQDAIDNGRNGKGCIAVTASGAYAENGMSRFPRYMDDVIVVGSTDKCGKRIGAHECTTGSDCCSCNAGDRLSLMAPGCAVPTTKMNHLYHLSDCSSISAPQVCGVAALILSVNPNLTANQVRYIMESTAQKVGGYNYITSSDHPNGTWNSEMGYGLVDAGAAVQMAQSLLSITDTYIKDSPDDDGTEPNISDYQVTNSPDIWITQDGYEVEQVAEGETYQVHIRVHNPSDFPTFTTRLNVNWCIFSGDLQWNYHWTIPSPVCGLARHGVIANNYSVGIIAPHSSSTLVFDWTAPSHNSNICMLAPTITPMTFVATINDGRITIGKNSLHYPIEEYVRQNNNVAMKRLTFAPFGSGPILSLSPNPTHDLLTISLNGEALSSVAGLQIVITDIYGNVLLKHSFNTDVRNTQINTSSFHAGRYTVSLIQDGSFIESEELIVY